MPWARASSATRTLNCPASVYLPKVDHSGPAAEWGTAVHTAKEGRDPGRQDVRDWWALHEMFWPRSTLWPDGQHERGLGLHIDPFEYRVDKAWEGEASDRWDLDDTWMTGAADWYTKDGPVLWVDDLKTGGFVDPPPTDQLTFYATALARHLDTKTDVMTSITHWPRYPKGKGPVRSAALVTYQERQTFEERIAEAKRAADARLGPNPGSWCTWCPCKGCPYNAV